MASNLDIDQTLLTKLVQSGGFKSKKEAVNQALTEAVQRREQMKITQAFGKIHFDPKYDYKAGRRKR